MKYHVFANGSGQPLEHVWLESLEEVILLWQHAREYAFGFFVIYPNGQVMQFTGGSTPLIMHRKFE